jgi:hypothetical protein
MLKFCVDNSFIDGEIAIDKLDIIFCHLGANIWVGEDRVSKISIIYYLIQ